MSVRTNVIIAVLALVGGVALRATPAQAQGAVAQSTLAAQDSLTLHPGDLLRIQVWPDDKLGGEFTVEETGIVYLPLLGAVRTAGLPISRLRAQLRSSYAEVMKNPVVTVTPVFHVGVLGEVRSPGVQPVTPTQTLLDVIGMAGGFTNNADENKIRIIRAGQVIHIDASRVLEGGENAGKAAEELANLHLRSGDQILVPTHHGTVTFSGVVSFIGSMAAVAFLVDRVVRGK
ncbi:MAG TPA: polysaccharide biosynthesis/export family protein [Longimicrobiales bacterium]|nr:polysaccharide biosynthesis/export family protein [Longimicrobiales bacterium]